MKAALLEEALEPPRPPTRCRSPRAPPRSGWTSRCPRGCRGRARRRPRARPPRARGRARAAGSPTWRTAARRVAGRWCRAAPTRDGVGGSRLPSPRRRGRPPDRRDRGGAPLAARRRARGLAHGRPRRVMRFEDFDLGTFMVSEVAPERLGPKVGRDPVRAARQPAAARGAEAYFAHDLDIASTADALHMHRNSLRYRIARAEQVLGRSLKQPRRSRRSTSRSWRRPGRARPVGSRPMDDEQPTAPYLDAVVAYAFRGPRATTSPATRAAREPIPACARRSASTRSPPTCPQDIHGIDLGPSPTPYERAEQLAAEAFGAERTFFLTNGATQGNHTLCLALAPLGAKIVAQRNSHASIVDGLVLSGGMPHFVAPGVRRGARHHALRHAGRARGARCATRRTRAPRSSSPRPTTGWRPTSPGWPRSRTRRGCRSSSTSRGGRTSASHDMLPPTALSQGADAMLTSTHKIAGSLTQSAMLHVGAGGRIDVGGGGARAAAAALDEPVVAAAGVARRRPPPARAARRAAAARDARGDRGRAREARDDPGHRARRRRRWSGGWASRATTRCGSCSTSAAPAAPATRSPTRCAAPTTCTSSCRCRRRSCSSSGWASPPAALRRLAGDVDEVVKRARAAGRDGAARPPAASLRNEVAVPPRDAFLGEAEQVAVDDAVGRISCESIASYPPGVPALLPGERISAETVAYLRELAASGARLHGASDPRVPDHQRAPGGAMIDPARALGAVRREARLRGPADVRRRAVHAGPRRARGLRRRDRRRADGRPRLRPPGGALRRRARSARRAARRVRTSRPRSTRSRHCAFVDFGDAPVMPADPRDVHAAIEATSARCSAAGVLPVVARRRPLDHRAVRARLRGRPRAGRDGPLRHAHRHRRGGLRRRRSRTARSCSGWSTRATSTADALRPDRPARLLAGRDRVRLAGRARASRACSSTTSATSASARSSRGAIDGRRPGPGAT